MGKMFEYFYTLRRFICVSFCIYVDVYHPNLTFNKITFKVILIRITIFISFSNMLCIM